MDSIYMFLKSCKYECLSKNNCITARVIQVYMVFYICNGVIAFFDPVCSDVLKKVLLPNFTSFIKTNYNFM